MNTRTGSDGMEQSALARKTQQLQEVVQELLQLEAQLGEATRQKNAVAAAAYAVIGIAVDSINTCAEFSLNAATQVAEGQMQVEVSSAEVLHLAVVCACRFKTCTHQSHEILPHRNSWKLQHLVRYLRPKFRLLYKAGPTHKAAWACPAPQVTFRQLKAASLRILSTFFEVHLKKTFKHIVIYRTTHMFCV